MKNPDGKEPIPVFLANETLTGKLQRIATGVRFLHSKAFGKRGHTYTGAGTNGGENGGFADCKYLLYLISSLQFSVTVYLKSGGFVFIKVIPSETL
jgi:hypothetical protein